MGEILSALSADMVDVPGSTPAHPEAPAAVAQPKEFDSGESEVRPPSADPEFPSAPPGIPSSAGAGTVTARSTRKPKLDPIQAGIIRVLSYSKLFEYGSGKFYPWKDVSDSLAYNFIQGDDDARLPGILQDLHQKIPDFQYRLNSEQRYELSMKCVHPPRKPSNYVTEGAMKYFRVYGVREVSIRRLTSFLDPFDKFKHSPEDMLSLAVLDPERLMIHENPKHPPCTLLMARPNVHIQNYRFPGGAEDERPWKRMRSLDDEMAGLAHQELPRLQTESGALQVPGLPMHGNVANTVPGSAAPSSSPSGSVVIEHTAPALE
jgi:hypothetical protein